MAARLCVALIMAACGRGNTFVCASDQACSSASVTGRCEGDGFCSFVDGSCDSGRRYGQDSGPMSNQCVPAIVDAGVVVDAPAIDAAIDGLPPIPFCDPADPALVACYEFENTATDGSSHHLDATMTNVTFVPGQVGLAMQFAANSAADVVENGALDVAELTIEAWIKPAALPGNRAGIVDNDLQWGFFLQSNGNLQCTSVNAAANVQPGVWTHVACTVDGTTARVYANGVVVGMAGQGPLGNGGNTGISIAADNPPGSGSPLVGLIDQVRIMSRARSSVEICADTGLTTCL